MERLVSKLELRNFNLKQILKQYNLLVLLIIFIIGSSIASPNFLTTRNILNLLQQSAVVGLVSVGMTFVILIGGIDLSVGSVLALAGMVCSMLLKANVPVLISIFLSVCVGAVLGLITGIVITKFKLPDFIATLAMMVTARGLTLLLTDGKPVFGLTGEFKTIGGGYILGIPVSGILWLCTVFIAVVILRYTEFGRSLYSIGGNREAAHLSGIRVSLNNTLVYVISGALAAFAGVVLASWLSVGQPTAGKGIELDVIAAVVLGGTSLAGGIGSASGTLGGVLLLIIITNTFNLVGLSSYYQQIFQGIIIVGALLLNKISIDK